MAKQGDVQPFIDAIDEVKPLLAGDFVPFRRKPDVRGGSDERQLCLDREAGCHLMLLGRSLGVFDDVDLNAIGQRIGDKAVAVRAVLHLLQLLRAYRKAGTETHHWRQVHPDPDLLVANYHQ